jgi:hypothetical protein
MRETYTRKLAERIDAVMCLMLNRLQPRGSEDVIDPLDVERYVAQCNGLNRQQYYSTEPMEEVRVKSDA